MAQPWEPREAPVGGVPLCVVLDCKCREVCIRHGVTPRSDLAAELGEKCPVPWAWLHGDDGRCSAERLDDGLAAARAFIEKAIG